MSVLGLRPLARRVAVLLAVLCAVLLGSSGPALAIEQDGDAIDTKYAQLGGAAGPLGPQETSEGCFLVDGGCWGGYANGAIFWSPATGAQAILRRDMWWEYLDRDHEYGPLGYPVVDTFCGLRDGGCGQHFQGGSVYWSPPMGEPVSVIGAYEDAWAAAGWERGWLGYPTSDQFCGLVHDGCGQHFQGGSIYSSPATGLSVVRADIRTRWAALGWERSYYGYPVGSTFCGLRDGGCGQHFERGSVYWTPARGALDVDRRLSSAWAAQGWERGRLGYPVTHTFCDLRDGGCGQHFEGGSIYRTASAPYGSGRIVLPVVRDRWAAQGWERGPLGYPMSDTFCGLRDGGCGQHFVSGSVYGSPAGTFVVPGFALHSASSTGIRAAWERQGWERGPLGHPTGEAFCGLRDGGCGQHFQGGSIYTATDWAVGHVVPPAIERLWAAQQWERGPLGYPVGPATSEGGVLRQVFQGGTLTAR